MRSAAVSRWSAQLTHALSVPALVRHWQRGGRSSTEMVTVVMRFFFTTSRKCSASWPVLPSICSLAGADPLTEHGTALSERLELLRIEVKRRRRREPRPPERS